MEARRPSVWSPSLIVAYLVLGAALYGHRLFSVLHAESSAVVAFCAFFFSGLHVLSYGRLASPDLRLLAAQLALPGIPLFMLTLSQLWVPNCAYWTGLVLYVTFATPSVILGFALATVIRVYVPRLRRTAFMLVALALAIGGTLYDLVLHPQFYVLNHVFGGVLGPVYEEALYVRPGLFAFRALTILWALVLLMASARRDGFSEAAAWRATSRRILLGASALVIGLIYLFSAQLGINTPEWYVQRTLGGKLQTPHFEIYFDPQSTDSVALRTLADDHEYRFEWLAARLGVRPSVRIRSYIYPTLDVKRRLTGAGLTDVSPVWLARPQIHTRRASYTQTFGHELVHAFSREFGLPLIHASPYVGLVEGLAVALEPPDGRPSAHEQLSVAMQRAQVLDVGLQSRPARQIVEMLSPAGFWTSRGSVSYAAAGSFVQYLIEHYGAARFRAVYAWGNFERVYGRSLHTLASEWEAFVRAIPYVERAADDLVTRRFTLPSLFETVCPHFQPAHVTQYRKAMDFLAVGDTSAADEALEHALRLKPDAPYPLTVWTTLRLLAAEPGRALAGLGEIPDTAATPSLHVLYGDVLALHGNRLGALRQYEAALRRLPLDARDARAAVLIRRLGGGTGTVVGALYGHEAVDRGPVEPAASAARRLASALHAIRIGAADSAYFRLMPQVILPDGSLNVAERHLLDRMLSDWRGRVALQVGAYPEAEVQLSRAMRLAAAIGDYAHVAELEDALSRVRWLQRPSEPGVAALIISPGVGD